MPQQILNALTGLAQLLEIAGAGALVVGFLMATVRYVRELRALGAVQAYDRYRQSLGRVVITGLEILVAATIIKTITVDPTPTSLGLLAIMIAIRTILSWSIALEINGRWPWQKRPTIELQEPTDG